MKKLYLIEGIPGSGKTTMARKLAEYLKLEQQDKETKSPVKLFVEGDLHPADMAWCALLTKAEQEELINKNLNYEGAIRKNSTNWRDNSIIAYTKIDNLPGKLEDYFESKEVYDGRVPFETFCEVHESRWETFARTAEGTYIFECVFLQNFVNELFLFHDKTEEEVKAFLQRIASAVSEFSPELIYLNVDTKKSLNRAACERVDEKGRHVWENRVIEYVEKSPYGKKHGVKGLSGMQDYFEKRRQFELSVLKELPVLSHVLNLTLEKQEETEKEFLQSIQNKL